MNGHAASLLALILLSLPAPAAGDCRPAWDATLDAIDQAQIGIGLKQRLEANTERAWRTFSAAREEHLTIAVGGIDDALALLDSRPISAMPESIREPLERSIEDLKQCMLAAPPPTYGTVTIQAIIDPEVDGSTVNAGAGLVVLAFEEELGRTNDAGQSTIRLPVGTTIVSVAEPLYLQGDADVTVLPGENPLLTIELIDGRHLTAPTTGYLVERNDDGIVAVSSATFTFEFRDGDTLVPIEGIEDLTNMLPGEDPENNIADFFEVSRAGRIVAKDAAALFKSIEQGSSPTTFAVTALDSRHRIHFAEIAFFQGRHALSGQLTAPSSRPDLQMAGTPLTLSLMDSPLIIHGESDALGGFGFPDLPRDTFTLKGEKVVDGRYYYVDEIIVLNEDKHLNVPFVHYSDPASDSAQ